MFKIIEKALIGIVGSVIVLMSSWTVGMLVSALGYFAAKVFTGVPLSASGQENVMVATVAVCLAMAGYLLFKPTWQGHRS